MRDKALEAIIHGFLIQASGNMWAATEFHPPVSRRFIVDSTMEYTASVTGTDLVKINNAWGLTPGWNCQEQQVIQRDCARNEKVLQFNTRCLSRPRRPEMGRVTSE